MNTASRIDPIRQQRGLSLVEIMVTLAISTITLGAALPSFENLRDRRHLEATAAQLQTDIMYTRSLAVANNRGLRIGFEASAAGSCYVVHTGAANDCHCTAAGAATCSPGAEAIRTVFFSPGGPVALQSNVRSILFDPVRGTSTPTGTLRLQGRHELTIHKIVNIMGRVRSCTPTPALSGYPRC